MGRRERRGDGVGRVEEVLDVLGRGATGGPDGVDEVLELRVAEAAQADEVLNVVRRT